MGNTPDALRTLLKPIDRRGIRVPSRIILAPINTGFATDGVPDSRLTAFHGARAGRGIGISMVGNVAVSLGARTNGSTAVLTRGLSLSRLSETARAIEKAGSVSAIQLAECPSFLAPTRQWNCKDKNAERDRLRDSIMSISEFVISKAISEFVLAASLAVEAGYCLIQIHAAHGYLLSLLLNPTINLRKDRYSPEKEWLESFVAELRSVGMNLLSFRLSIQSGLSESAGDWDFCKIVAHRLEKCGVDLVDLSNGFYTVQRQEIYPKRSNGKPPYLAYARELAIELDTLVAFAGNINSFDGLDALPENLLVAVGRALIADPEFVVKSNEGRDHDIIQCKSSGRCHYHTLGNTHLSCGANPDVGREW